MREALSDGREEHSRWHPGMNVHLLYWRRDAEAAQAWCGELARVDVGDLGHGRVDAVHVFSFHHQNRLGRIKMELEAQINQPVYVSESVCF